MSNPKDTVESILAGAVRKIAPGVEVGLRLDLPRNPAHGDYATSVALQLAKPLGRKPREIAEDIVKATQAEIERNGASLEIAGAGFINIRIGSGQKLKIGQRALNESANFGRTKAVSPEKIQVEVVSANPTGPLHVGHGRQAALGDALAALLEAQGHAVTREFYYNDAGAQIQNLVLSVQARAKGLEPGAPGWPADGYAGEYIREIAEDFARQKGDLSDAETVRRFAVAFLRKEQDLDLQKFGVRFDVYTLESSMYSEGKVDAAVQGLVASGKTYEKDGALWLRTTDYGDDKDRVLRKSDGSYTYFVPDVAYHVTKWQRGFRKVINVQGTDHHSTVTRVRAGLQALGIGIPPGYPDYVLHNLVKVVRG